MECPECGAVLVYDDEHDQYDCHECGETFDSQDLDA